MRILSGIQPSGALHIGNYFGMMRPSIELQEKGEAFYFIANYHSMTSLFNAAERRQNTLDVALDFLACGLDPKKSVFFRQSDVPEVAELAWMLTTLPPQDPTPEAEKIRALQLVKLVAPPDVAQSFEDRLRAGGLGYGDLKKALFEHYWNYFAAARERRKELVANLDYVNKVLAEG